MAGHKDRQHRKHKHLASTVKESTKSFWESSPSDSFSPVEILNSQIPYNIENEGVATSCKRIKPSPRNEQHSTGVEIVSENSKARRTEDSHPKFLLLESSPDTQPANARRRPKEVMLGMLADLGKRAVEAVTPDSFLERYHRPGNSLPDYGGHDPSAVPIDMPSRQKLARPAIPGGPKPRNTLMNGSSQSPLQRPERKSDHRIPRKAFDFASNEYRPDSHTSKKQKIDGRTAKAIDAPNTIELDGADGSSTILISQSSPASWGAKSVQSLSSSTVRSNPPSTSFGNVDEFTNIEKLLRPLSKRNRSSGQATNELEPDLSIVSESQLTVEADPIEDSGPEVSTEYKGSANYRPARPKGVRNKASGRGGLIRQQPRLAHESLYHMANGIQTPTTKANAQSVDGYAQASHSSLQISKGSIRTFASKETTIEIEDDDSIDQLQAENETTSQPKRKWNPMQPFAKVKSDSISTAGDIPPSEITKTRRKAVGKDLNPTLESEIFFDLEHFQTGSLKWTKEDHPNPFRLHVDSKKLEFHLIEQGMDISIASTNKPVEVRTASKFFYSLENQSVIIHKAMDLEEKGTSMILLIFSNDTERACFVSMLKNLRPGILENIKSSDYIERTFSLQTQNLTKLAKPSTTNTEKPADIQLLESRQSKRNSSSAGYTNTRETPNSGRRRRSDGSDELASIPQPHRRKMVQAMTIPASSKSPTRFNIEIESDGNGEEDIPVFQMPNTNVVYYPPGSHYNTRSANFSRRDELHPSRRSSPMPERWTIQNPNWSERWKSDPFVFPANQKKQTPVDRRDIERLDDGEFLNDNLIAFYLRYLERVTEIQAPDIFQRVLFMNTFFYATLTSGVGRRDINYDAVKRWTTKIDVFAYDYIVVPINENTHWYLAIICNVPGILPQETEELGGGLIIPGSKSASPTNQLEHMSLEDHADQQLSEWPNEDLQIQSPSRPLFSGHSNSPLDSASVEPPGKAVAEPEPHEAIQRDSKVKGGKRRSIAPLRKYGAKDPRIMTLDSLGNPHSLTCSNLKHYLVSEVKERKGLDISPGSLGMTVKNIPQQTNFCDCGIFLLMYVELFLDDPDGFVSSIMQGGVGMKKDWPDAPTMRKNMREIILELQGVDADAQDEILSRRKPPGFTATANHWMPQKSSMSGSTTPSSRKLNHSSNVKVEKAEESNVESAKRSNRLIDETFNRAGLAVIVKQKQSLRSEVEQVNSSSTIQLETGRANAQRALVQSSQDESSGSFEIQDVQQQEIRSGTPIDIDSDEDASPNGHRGSYDEHRSGPLERISTGYAESQHPNDANVIANSPNRIGTEDSFEDIIVDKVPAPRTSPRRSRQQVSSSPSTPISEKTTRSRLLRHSPRTSRDDAPKTFLRR